MKKSKYLLLIIISLFFVIPTVSARPQTYERTEENNYGVSKFNPDILDKDIIKNTPYVNPKEKIYDFSDVITDKEESILLEKINDYIEKTGFDLIIVTVNLPYYSDSKNDSYASDFYDYNDFGFKEHNYSGVLLLRNTYISDPYYDYYMFGDAQLYYNDTHRADEILDGIYDDLHSHNYLDGMSDFIDYLDYYYDAGIPSSYKYYYVDDMGYLRKKYVPPYLFAFIISAICTTVSIIIMRNKNKMVKVSKEANMYLKKDSINITKKLNKFINSHTTSYVMSSSSSSGGGGGFHSSSGSSGGGFSSGGGRHG